MVREGLAGQPVQKEKAQEIIPGFFKKQERWGIEPSLSICRPMRP
jgi:hypothetical protein